jgi:hypothetical protein
VCARVLTPKQRKKRPSSGLWARAATFPSMCPRTRPSARPPPKRTRSCSNTPLLISYGCSAVFSFIFFHSAFE